jgi:hypothetical protein
MKKTTCLTIAAVAFMSSLFSCKSHEKISQVAPTTEISTDAADAVSNQKSDTAARAFFASIERTACYGTCPVYKMVIYNDGFVELEGIRFIDQIGSFTSKISAAQIRNFEIRAHRTGFMDMKESYDAPITDVPSATTTLVLNGVSKSVYRRADFPPAILQLEVLFDELLKSQKWKPEQEAE